MARQIGKMLNAREPKIVNGPQILDKYVGESEANIRRLFAEAEEEEKRVSRCPAVSKRVLSFVANNVSFISWVPTVACISSFLMKSMLFANPVVQWLELREFTILLLISF